MDPMDPWIPWIPWIPSIPWNPWIWQIFKSPGNSQRIGPGIYFLYGIVQNFAANNVGFHPKSGHSRFLTLFLNFFFSNLGNSGHKSAFGLPEAGAPPPHPQKVSLRPPGARARARPGQGQCQGQGRGPKICLFPLS